ncbi:MAG: acyl-CoA dehydrogenase protein [Acidimicrobiia bacterium]|nr:acyl-CoA dehydrogenase protein [Acidimicrobiia bacterium]
MNVTIAPIPASYDAYRAELRQFITAHRPTLGWKPRTGLRVPDSAADVAALRSWMAALYDAGYGAGRFSEAPTDPFEQRILAEELGATGLPAVLGNPLVSGALLAYGTAEQKAQYLPAMARADHIWTQLFSEPNAGSDLTGLQTRGRLDGDHYVIDGQKVWSTWASWSDYGYLLARTEPIAGAGGITAFILPMRSPGVDVRPLREMTGTTDFNEVFLDQVRVPVGNVIGQPGEGWKVAAASLVSERGGVGAAGSGDSVTALVRLAQHHQRDGRACIEDSAVRQEIGAFAARSRIQRYLSYQVATKAGNGTIGAADAPVTKVWFSELNLALAEYGLNLQGARSALVEGDPGAYEDGKWQDMFLYARAWTIAGGSNEIMRNLIAERGLGLPREPHRRESSQ